MDNLKLWISQSGFSVSNCKLCMFILLLISKCKVCIVNSLKHIFANVFIFFTFKEEMSLIFNYIAMVAQPFINVCADISPSFDLQTMRTDSKRANISFHRSIMDDFEIGLQSEILFQ